MLVLLRDLMSGKQYGADCPETEAIAVCTIGCASDCEICLPHAAFPDVGRRELRLVAAHGGHSLLELSRACCALDGLHFTETELTAGVHDLQINDHRFELTVR